MTRDAVGRCWQVVSGFALSLHTVVADLTVSCDAGMIKARPGKRGGVMAVVAGRFRHKMVGRLADSDDIVMARRTRA